MAKCIASFSQRGLRQVHITAKGVSTVRTSLTRWSALVLNRVWRTGTYKPIISIAYISFLNMEHSGRKS